MVLNYTDIRKILFIDIETVPITEEFNQLEEGLKSILQKQYQKEIDREGNETLSFEKLYLKYGGIKSEYSKVICIGLSILSLDAQGTLSLRRKIIGCEKENESESDILKEFAQLINDKYTLETLVFCGHNILEFDIPLLCRRMLINGIPIPNAMNYQNKKPWDYALLDTMKLWSFGDYKNYTSLDLLCRIFNIPTPKQELSGDKVKDAYYKEKDFSKIQKYCIADVVATAQLLLKLNGKDLLTENQIL